MIKTLRETANNSLSHTSSADDVLKSLDSMIARTQNLKRKLGGCAEEEERLHRQSKARVQHLGDLYTMQSLDDVRYERWSRKRLDRLLVDYMLREGFTESAELLAGEEAIGELVDVPTFVAAKRIREALASGSVVEALNWCAENKKELRKTDVRSSRDYSFQPVVLLTCALDRIPSSSTSASNSTSSCYAQETTPTCSTQSPTPRNTFSHTERPTRTRSSK